MKFQSMDEFRLWLWANSRYNFDGGSQGECYKIGNCVYKIFIQYIDDCFDYLINYDSDSLLRFSHIKNGTYVWPNDVITVDDIVVGYTMDYVKAKSLCKIDPLNVNLNKLVSSLKKANNDIKIISDNGVSTFDVCYNILYGANGFKVIDTVEYSCSKDDKLETFKHNNYMFASGVKLFLVDGYFDNVIRNSKLLHEMYYCKDVDMLDFLFEFRRSLCEIEGNEIVRLGEAKKSIKRVKSLNYIRSLNKFDEF